MDIFSYGDTDACFDFKIEKVWDDDVSYAVGQRRVRLVFVKNGLAL